LQTELDDETIGDDSKEDASREKSKFCSDIGQRHCHFDQRQLEFVFFLYHYNLLDVVEGVDDGVFYVVVEEPPEVNNQIRGDIDNQRWILRSVGSQIIKDNLDSNVSI
jgi:hypothetical protein